MILTGSAPTRIDLAGGTLDIWPINTLIRHPSTVNMAFSCPVELSVQPGEHYGVRMGSESHRWSSVDEMKQGAFALFGWVLEMFPDSGPVEIGILGQPPRGSGLGTSSAMILLLYRMMCLLTGHPEEPTQSIRICRDLEAGHLGYPAGVQDYFPPLMGGSLCIRYPAGGFQVSSLPWKDELSESISVYYTGVEHHSGKVNWNVFRQVMEGDQITLDRLQDIADTAQEMTKVWEEGNPETLGKLVSREWKVRSSLHPEKNHPVISEVIERSLSLGAYGAKAAGAGGGGSVILVHPPEIKQALTSAITFPGGRFLSAGPTPDKMVIRPVESGHERT